MYHDSKIVILSKPVSSQLVGGVVLIVFLALGLGFMSYSVSVRAEKIQKDIVRKTAAVERLEEDKARMHVDLQAYEDAINEFKQILFKERDVSLFLTGISEISQKNKVAVLAIKNLAEKKIAIDTPASGKKGLDTFLEEKKMIFTIAVTPLQVEMEGRLDDVLTVLGALEKTRQLLTVSDFNFTARGYPNMRVSFKIDLYGLGEKNVKK